MEDYSINEHLYKRMKLDLKLKLVEYSLLKMSMTCSYPRLN